MMLGHVLEMGRVEKRKNTGGKRLAVRIKKVSSCFRGLII